MTTRHTQPKRVVTGLLFLAGLAVISACGENLFGEGQPPEVTGFTADAETVTEGDTVTFSVQAEGTRNVNRIRVRLTGALEDDTTFTLADEEQGTSVDGALRLGIPMGTVSPELVAQAWAIDVADDTSEGAVSTTVMIEDATVPAVSAAPLGTEVNSGDMIRVEVQASDARGIARVEVEVTDRATYFDTIVATVDPAVREYSATLQMPAPNLLNTELSLIPQAVDINGLSAVGDTSAVSISDGVGPEFLSLSTVPDSTIALGDSLQVTVEVRDPSGIRQVSFIGLQYDGDPQAGTDSVVERFIQRTINLPRPTIGDALPKRFTFRPRLEQLDIADTATIDLIIVATDSLGNTSDTTKVMFVGAPDVKIDWPQTDTFDIQVQDTFRVDVALNDPTAFSVAQLRITENDGSLTEVPLTLPARTDTPFVVSQNLARGSAGIINVQAVATNRDGIEGQSRSVAVRILSAPPPDSVPPVVSLSAARLTPTGSEERMERLDSLSVTVSAFDDVLGLARSGVKIFIHRLTDPGATGAQDSLYALVTADTTFATPSRNLERFEFRVAVDSLFGALGLSDRSVLDSIFPDTLVLGIHAFAADAADQVACSTGSEEQQECAPSGYSATEFYHIFGDTTGLEMRVEAVRGATVLLDRSDAVIADLAIDTVDDRLFLSNVTENLVEFLQLDQDPENYAFQNPVQVGSEPVGLFLGERVVRTGENGFGGISVTAGDTVPTLLVSNSGGTNMSLVHMDANAANVQEVDLVRLRTQNSTLFELQVSEDENGFEKYSDPPEVIDLADRPQFLAQDSLLRIVYSTRATPSAELTSVRFVHVDPDPNVTNDGPEVRFLLTDDMVEPDEQGRTWVMGNIDLVDPRRYETGPDSIRLFSHYPGFPDSVVVTPFFADVALAAADLRLQMDTIMANRGIPNQAPMFYPFVRAGSWLFDVLGWGDTTFVSASGNRGRVAIGEGAVSPTGRIMIWEAFENARYSNHIQIQDLTNNAAEVVLGVGLNEDGSLGVARGNEATYFFTPDLRLQGLYRQADFGGAGATFHPSHDDVNDGGHTSADGAGVAFTATSNHSIDVVNTFHFNQVNSLVVRNDIVGPLRAGPPLQTDNSGLTCPTDLDCIVAKLYGITDAGGVVVVDVRRRDLEPYATP